MLKGGMLPHIPVNPLSIGGYVFPFEPLIDIRAGKKIVQTGVPGMDGTIKEFVGFEDYTISVNITLQGADFSSVMAELAGLIALWEREESLIIINAKTAAYGIYKVVFDSIDHPETEGMPGTEKLLLHFTSDNEYDFEVM